MTITLFKWGRSKTRQRCLRPVRPVVLAAVCLLVWMCAGIAPSQVTYNVVDLGDLGGGSSWAYGINNSGQISGTSSASDGSAHAFVYSNGVMSDLGPLGDSAGGDSGLGSLGGGSTVVHGNNNINQIVGASTTTNGQYHAFLYSDGVMTDLGTLGGTRSFAYGINDMSQIVGDGYTASRADHAFLYSAGVMTDIGTLAGYTSSWAMGINNRGQIVGLSFTLTPQNAHATVYSNGRMADLNTQIPGGSSWVLQEATAINDRGQIVGFGTHGSVLTRAFLLTPITPLPPVATTMTLTNVSEGCFFPGQSLTASYRVSPSGSGTVTVTNELSAVTAPAPMGTLTLLLTNVGTFHFGATYSGDAIFLRSSSSPPVSRTVLSMTNPAAWSAALVISNGTRFLQTSLMQQWLTLSNITSQTLAAVRVTVHLSAADQAKHIIVYNASGTNGAGEPYLQHNYPVPPGGSVTFTAEFYSPDRVTVPTPTFTVELVTPQALVVPVSTPQAVRRPPVVLAPDNALLIDFLTVKGATYYILYKDDLASAFWRVAQPPVMGTGYDVQWVDDGPPKTASPPSSVPQRYYQVLKAD